MSLGMPAGFWLIFWGVLGGTVWVLVTMVLSIPPLLDDWHWSARWASGIAAIIVFAAGCATLTVFFP